MLKHSNFLVIIFCIICLFACVTKAHLKPPPLTKEYIKTEFVEYSIQAGAFQSFKNADAYSRKLDKYVDAFSFKDKDGFFKVRFGNFSSKKVALKRARQLKSDNIIDAYFLVVPEKYDNDHIRALKIREQIVKEAENYIGVPYSWGGNSSVTGFDCSGFTLSVFRKSGIMLPRTSKQQFKTGVFVPRKNLQKGDLVFFKKMGRKVSHVGIYIGNQRFIHSPGKGKTVCYQFLNSSYYKKHYAGARTFL